jgi:hypothetical protein
MNKSFYQWVSIGWLIAKLSFFVLLSMEAAEILVVAYQRF